MRNSSSPRWLRVLSSNRRLQATLGVLLVLVASVGVGGVLLRRAHAATTWNVANTGADTPGCGAVATPCLTIQYAINKASSGDTILVAAGTYHITSTISVGKSLMILGAQAGVDARTRSGSESIIDASGVPGGGSANGIDVTTSNVTINGFTISGATGVCVTAAPADNFLFENDIVTTCNSGVSELGGDGITITHNLLQHMDTNSAAPIAEDAIYDDFHFSNMVISDNNIFSSGQPITIPYDPTVSPGSITISGNQIENGSFLWNVTGSFSGNTVTGNAAVANNDGGPPGIPTFGVRLGGQTSGFSITGNSFTNLQASAIKVRTDTVYGYTNNVNTSITNNTINENVGVEDSNSYSNLMDLRDMSGSSNNVSGNALTLSGAYSAGATVTYAIQLQGSFGTLNLSNNVLNGGGVGGTSPTPPTSGIAVVDPLSATSTIHLTDNLITAFVDGINAPNMTAGASVAGTQNCIYHNSANGAVNGSTGATISAANNWWGTPNGPIGPGNPGGTGNAVSSNITFLPFLGASVPSVCAAPTTTLTIGNPQVAGSPVQVSTATPLTLNATPGYQPVGSIHYRFYPTSTTPPAFTVVNGHTASFMLSGANGTYVVEWYAVDVTTNEEVRHTETLQLATITPGLDVAGTGGVPQTGSPDTGPGSPANGTIASTGSSASSGTSLPAKPVARSAQPKVSRPAVGPSLPLWEQIAIGLLLLLVVLGGVGFLLWRARRAPQPVE